RRERVAGPDSGPPCPLGASQRRFLLCSFCRTPSAVLVSERTLDPSRLHASGGRLAPTNDRKWSSGTAAVTAPPAQGPRGVPRTGTAPGAYRVGGLAQRFGQTERTDAWWFLPLLQALGLLALIG